MRSGIAGFAAVSFLGFALLQLNDPDPLRWAAIYLAASGTCAAEALSRSSRLRCLLVAAVALLWAAWWTLSGQLGGEPMHYGPSWGPLAREGTRELSGLLIVAATLLGLAAWRSESPGATAG